MSEKWKPIPGHPSYEVSSKGRVRSFRQVNRQGRLLNPSPGGKGHLQVSLAPSGKFFTVHKLVLLTFVGEPPEGKPLALHKDGNVEHNDVENLYWGTYADNANDSVRHGTHPQASRTECKYGHPIDGVRLRPDGTVRQRYCKQCNRDQVREWKRSHRK